MLTRSEIFQIVAEFKKKAAPQYGIRRLGIFGSVARDEAREQSDVDIVIETETPDPFNLVHIKEALENRLERHVDIVRIRPGMNPFLKQRIEKEARYV
jgi:uncharacterized protein